MGLEGPCGYAEEGRGQARWGRWQRENMFLLLTHQSEGGGSLSREVVPRRFYC